MDNRTSFSIKYKPYFLSEFGMNQYLYGALKLLLAANDLNILLYGPSGCGKTILIDILIREYYELKKDDPMPTGNMICINNLHEQGIGFYRNDMKTFCQSRCSIPGKKKLIIIDDIDSVNEQSQQVFRNYMDKYGKNMNFIAVCSNMQKVIESIQSRVHIMRVVQLTMPQIQIHMDRIIEKESIDIDEPSKKHLLLVCNQSVKNMINYLEKIHILQRKINIDLCKQICSNISIHQFEQYVNYLQNGQLCSAIHVFYGMYHHGYSVIDILDFFYNFVKNTEMLDETLKYKLVPILCKYITIFHTLHEDKIELALFTNNAYAVFNPVHMNL